MDMFQIRKLRFLRRRKEDLVGIEYSPGEIHSAPVFNFRRYLFTSTF